MQGFAAGDPVIYRREKHSSRPGPRARNIDPAPLGEYYSYEVDKFWMVKEVQPGGVLVLITRRGKTHLVPPDDPRLRRPHWWERLLYNNRFPAQPPTMAAGGI